MTNTAPQGLSPAQHGMWVTEQVLHAGSAHHLSLTVRFTGPPDAAALAAACARVTRLHPVLTARLDPAGPALEPGVAGAELRRLSCAPQEVAAVLHAETVRPFDLAGGPLVRFALVDGGQDGQQLHVVAHHLVFDGTSKDVLLAALGGAPAPAARPGPPPVPGESAVAAAAAFWSGRDHGTGTPALPGLSAAPKDTCAPAPGASVPFALDTALRDRLTRAAADLGATPFEVLLAAWHTLLLRYGSTAPATALELSTRRPEDTGHIGLYVNELPVLTHPDPQRPFALFVQDVRTELRALYAHRTVPLARAVRGLTPRTALTPVSVSYRRRGDAELPEFGFGRVAAVDWTGFTHTVRNLLHLQLVDGPGRIDGSLQYRADAFAPGAPERIAGHFLTLLDAALAAPRTPLAGLPLLTGDERRRVLDSAAAAGPAACPPGATVVGMFTAQAGRTPDSVAVTGTDGEELTYRELHVSAAAFAARLGARGLGAGDLVGVLLPRSVDQLVAVLGVLTAGAAYLPLDPEHPAERLALVLGDAAPAALVTEGDAPAGLPAGVPVLTVAGPAAPAAAEPAPPEAGDPAYVIYTSGSTGTPKGVEVPHRALANLLATMSERLGTGAADRWLGLTTLSFDISTVELLLPLTAGARVVLVPEAHQRDGAALLKLIDAQQVTHVQATPSSWRLMLAAGLHRPDLVAVAGGEELPGPLARGLTDATGRLVNVYGPTETTVWSTLAELAAGGPVTIGGPLAATSVQVLDAYGAPVPDGITGELYLGGAGVAHGYRGRPGLTAQRFVPDPYGPPGSRLYRTGDLVRRTRDGLLEFAGRADTQIKLRGHRIELGEIEARIGEHPAVAQAAVVLDGGTDDPDGGQARLVAYTVPAAAPGAPASPEALRAHVAAALPAAMTPGVWVSLDAFPLTPNGKLDRGRLPAPPRTREQPVAPVSGAQGGSAADGGTDRVTSVVRDIWQHVLRLDDIGLDEDLFDLGGHSLTVTAIAGRIRRELGVDVPLDVFFDTPTINGVAAEVALLQQEEQR